MNQLEQLINQISQDKIDFKSGLELLFDHDQYNFQHVLSTLRNYIINSIPNKTNYNSEAYQTAIRTIPLKPTYTPIVLLKTYPTKIAFDKLVFLPESENIKTITALLWIFKITDTERRNTECKNGCGHFWHEL
ncbi:DUF5958 family protein [Flavobacterium defluvii]|uniref:Uncharacterized protein n=1 Tax=Flavobacterium defluvii TaxID=370979 RepID=A0A1M5W272_9FLAO|nr:DUF5958 family protein [Flavobacterium defluvii]SHH81303.1 hypothetical protein SAMN05443663_11273 [Flavobacterium defluvii]